MSLRRKIWLPVGALALVLAGGVTAVVLRTVRQGQMTRTASTIASIDWALREYLSEHPGWATTRPADESGEWRVLDESETRPLMLELERRYGIDAAPDHKEGGRVLDAWGVPLRIAVSRPPSGESLFELSSAGRDGAWGTADDQQWSGMSERGGGGPSGRSPSTQPAAATRSATP